MFQTEVIEKIKTHFVFSNFFYFENRTVYEIMWENIVELDRPQMAVWRMRNACWITKTTNTHSEYVNYFSTATMVAQMQLDIRLYVHCLFGSALCRHVFDYKAKLVLGINS